MKNSLELKNEVLSDIQETARLSVNKMRLQEEISLLSRDFFLLKEQTDAMANQRDSLASTIVSLNKDKEKAETRLKALLAATQESTDLSKEIFDKRNELEEINSKIEGLEHRIIDLDDVQEDIDAANEELRSLQKQTQHLYIEHDRIIEGAHNHAEAIKAEAEQEIKEIMASKAELDRRELAVSAKEKYLAERERGLATVESRWKRLYESKGANFKI